MSKNICYPSCLLPRNTWNEGSETEKSDGGRCKLRESETRQLREEPADPWRAQVMPEDELARASPSSEPPLSLLLASLSFSLFFKKFNWSRVECMKPSRQQVRARAWRQRCTGPFLLQTQHSGAAPVLSRARQSSILQLHGPDKLD